MLKIIIIDDEPNAREIITDIINVNCPNTTIVAEADSVKSGLLAINKYQPDIILLDIKLPDGTGFDILKNFDTINFKVIFITAYEEYAIKAFKFSALDYILKPIAQNELINAISKAQHSILIENINLQLKTYFANISNISKEVKKIVLKTSENIYIIDVKDIILCKSEGNYTKFFLNNDKRILVSRTLKEYDEMLTKYGFFRIHQSYLINLSYLIQYQRNSGFVIMKNTLKVPVSSRRKEQLFKVFEKI